MKARFEITELQKTRVGKITLTGNVLTDGRSLYFGIHDAISFDFNGKRYDRKIVSIDPGGVQGNFERNFSHGSKATITFICETLDEQQLLSNWDAKGEMAEIASNYERRFGKRDDENLTWKQKILVNKFTPLVLMILNLLFFFVWLPDDVAANYDIAFGIVGGFLTMALAFWMVFSLLPQLFENAPIFGGLACISTLFIFGFMFIKKTFDYSSGELDRFGVETVGIITDKSQYYGKNGRTIQDMDVQFYDAKNVPHNANIDISLSEYQRYEIGNRVEVRYSSQHPEIARLIYH